MEKKENVANGFGMHQAEPRFELFNILDVAPLAALQKKKTATEYAFLFPFISVQAWVLYLYLPISSDFGFRYWGVKVRLFWGWISNRVNYLYDLDWTGSRLYF